MLCPWCRFFCWARSRPRDGLGRADTHRRRRGRLRTVDSSTDAVGRPSRLVLSRQAGLARQPDVYLSALEGRSGRMVAVDLSHRGGGCDRRFWLLRRKLRGPLAGWLLFVGTLFPVLGFLNVFPFHLFVRRRSLSVSGQPGNYRARSGRSYSRSCRVATIQKTAWAIRSSCFYRRRWRCFPRNKATCTPTASRFTKPRSIAIPIAGWPTAIWAWG